MQHASSSLILCFTDFRPVMWMLNICLFVLDRLISNLDPNVSDDDIKVCGCVLALAHLCIRSAYTLEDI